MRLERVLRRLPRLPPALTPARRHSTAPPRARPPAMSAALQQPPWLRPEPTTPLPPLKVLNSLTRQKDDFVPLDGKRVKWYSCGPTVYDASHMGHARSYITFDIIRRILADYFSFDILYVMNITDIDDKIIVRARHNYLFEEFRDANPTVTAEVAGEARKAWDAFVAKNFGGKPWDEVVKAKTAGTVSEDPKFEIRYGAASNTLSLLESTAVGSPSAEFFSSSALRDVLAPYLDSLKGSTVSDPAVFRRLAAHWEREFLVDMRALNVRPPDLMTRVSEYVPEIVTFVQRIVANGFGYESGGSVYFDTLAFDRHPDHTYAKLEPWSAGNMKLVEEGEGDLSLGLSEKKSPADFALWKASKPGEPAWESPWGQGRPGWHIECSAMAYETLGETMDVHSGGVDLKFPHHDNEIAQSEACFKCRQWTNYFLHAGHLHIDGQKMSKSLKNFVTIRDALATYSARQIRLMFLLHSWHAVLDYKEDSMREAISVETTIGKFFLNARALIAEQRHLEASTDSTGSHNHREPERKLIDLLASAQDRVHAALCDNIDTPTAFGALLDLVGGANVYMTAKSKGGARPNAEVLEKVAGYVTRMVRIFGCVPDDVDQPIGWDAAAEKAGQDVMPYLRVLSGFRDGVREMARSKKPHSDFLALSDKLRDEVLPPLGVVVDDREDGTALVKLVDPETIAKEREDKARAQAEKQRKADEIKAREAEKKAAKLAKGEKKPQGLFTDAESASLYSKWDERGIPTHDAAGEELSKSKRKNLTKEFELQVKLHEEWKAWKREQDGGNVQVNGS
ncbi:tRNA synthetases class I (C) catalytic domain-containing protein [Hyaloraphidium curvatum]|nr:tRNA synthetases class I (C) catalytic domain-containing protein [Hyaloraphidium curvatum]